MSNYERNSVCYEPKELFDAMKSHKPAPEKDFGGDMIKISSLRYQVFMNSLSCNYCGIIGSRLYKERSVNKKGIPTSSRYHFNLYAVIEDGSEVLMTKDHIIPKAMGGGDSLQNLQTCCIICNHKKATMSHTEFNKLEKENV